MTPTQQKREALGSKHRCHFPPSPPPSVGLPSTQSHLWVDGLDHGKRTERAFIRLPPQSSRKLRKWCQRRGSFPTRWSGAVAGLGETALGSLIAASLWNAKKTQTPRGGLMAYASLCLAVPLFFFLLENTRGSWIMASDQMTFRWSEHPPFAPVLCVFTSFSRQTASTPLPSRGCVL